ncbi:MAG: hypothetical protein ACRYFZ_09770 [Janthinobacterium lividum]
MKFFLLCMAALTILCGAFWATDGPGSGMMWPTISFAALGAGTAIYNKARTGKWLSETAAGK